MKSSRWWLISIFIWFFFLYNVERLGEPINIATFVYIFTLISAVIIVLIPSLQQRPFYLLTLIALPPFFLLKFLLGYQIAGIHLPITVTEICMIGITIFLAIQVGRRLEELQEIVTNLTIEPLVKGSHPFERGQGQIYREIRRARHYHRPASILAISIPDESLESSLEQFIQEAERKIIKEYISARLANFLIKELQDTDIVTKRNDHFITFLPETTRENVSDIVRRLQVEARDQLGIKLRIGTSTFPDEAVTFERMLERAEMEMNRKPAEEFVHLESASTKTKSVLQI
jgi:hypothetical protein